MSLYSRAETNAQSLKVLNTTEKNSVDKYDHDDERDDTLTMIVHQTKSEFCDFLGNF